MRKSLTAALLTAAAVATLAMPAGAAVPSKPAKLVRACPDGVGTARLWFTRSKGALTKLAVDNPCAQHLMFHHEGDRDHTDEWLAAPGSHFNWGKKRIAQYNAGAVVPQLWKFASQECGDPNDTVRVVWRYNDVRHPVDESGEGC